MTWTLEVGQIRIEFLSTQTGALGVKFNKSKTGGHYEYFVPNESKNRIPTFNPKNPQKDFIDVRYYDQANNKYKREEIQRKYYDKEMPTVLITEDQMQQMFPLTKTAKAIQKQPVSKLTLVNVSASDGYYLLPVKEYENIVKYKKLIEFLGNDFVVTNPMRLRVRSTTAHNYAIFVDKRQNALVAIEVLVKSGMQPNPLG